MLPTMAHKHVLPSSHTPQLMLAMKNINLKLVLKIDKTMNIQQNII